MRPPGSLKILQSQRTDAASLLIEQLHAALVQGEREPFADPGIGHAKALTDGNEGAVRACVEIEEGVLAERLDKTHRQCGVDLAADIDSDMLGPNSQGSLAVTGRLQTLRECDVEQRGPESRDSVVAHDLAGNEIHRWRAEEIGDEVIDRV